jgi:poly-gamma-glutamate synthesis protein (capsule biosynthesis protein)
MDQIKILFSGDFAPIIPIDKIHDNHFTGLNEIFDSADLHVTNLEAPLTHSQISIKKTGPAIKANPAAISLLKQAKVSIACLANNHIFDYGEEGIEDTLETCSRNNIDTCGIVSRKDGMGHWLIKTIKDKKIGFLNYCEHEFSVREKGLTGACGYNPIDAYYDILQLKPQVDYLIVIYHGGNEYYPLPRPDLKRDFHYLAELGADSVIGHHTHVFSGIEIYNKKPLVYSLGNFFFPFEEEPESWNQGIMLNCMIGESIKFEFIPYYQCKDGLKVNLTEDDKKESALQTMKDLSSIIADDGKLEEAWKIYVQDTGEGLTSKILYPTKVDKLLLKLPFFKKYFSDGSRHRSLLNILRCTSLEQILIDSLKLKQ